MQENLKAAKKQFSKVGGSLMLGTLVIFAVQLLPSYIVQAVRPEWLQNGDFALLITIVPMYLIGMPFVIWLMKRLPAEAPKRHTMSAGQFAVTAIMCYSIMYCCNIIGNIMTSIIGLLKGGAVQNTILNVATSNNMVITFVYMVICAPIFEEYIFRKLIVDSTMRYGKGISIFLSGLMFALFHGNLNQFVYAFGLGIFLAFIYVKTGNLKITIALHMIINFVGGILGVLILKLINLEELLRVSASGDMQEMMEMLQNNMGGLIVYAVYVVALITIAITGFILLIVFRKRFRLGTEEASCQESMIPRGKRFSTLILNPGMLIYCLFWLAMIVVQLFM